MDGRKIRNKFALKHILISDVNSEFVLIWLTGKFVLCLEDQMRQANPSYHAWFNHIETIFDYVMETRVLLN